MKHIKNFNIMKKIICTTINEFLNENKKTKLSLEDAIEKANDVAPDKKPNERDHEEIILARQYIIDSMPKLRCDMSWEEFKPYGIAIQKQSSWGQSDNFYERNAKFEWEWGQKNPDKCKRLGY
jgi:hypothetical protein